MSKPQWTIGAAIALVLVCGVVGCGPAELKSQTTVPATMEVRHQGKPAAGAQVTLHPKQGDSEGFHLARPHGIVAADGSVQLSTYRGNDGAPEGDYAVTVIWTPPPPAGASEDDKPGPDRLAGRYADAAKTTLRASVRKDASEPIRLDLK